MSLFLTIALLFGGPILLAYILRFWTDREMAHVYAEFAGIEKLTNEKAVREVDRLIAAGVIDFESIGKGAQSENHEDVGAVELSRFAKQYLSVSSDEFRFFAPRDKVRIRGKDYRILGHSNDDQTTFLVRKNSDTVYSLDAEERDVDPFFQSATIWHAILFEARNTPNNSS